jgi:hypothetical protein
MRGLIHFFIPLSLVFLTSFAQAPVTDGNSLAHVARIVAILDAGVHQDALNNALTGFEKMKRAESLDSDILIIIDYSKSSNVERFFVVNMMDSTLRQSSLVAHGRNTGDEFATSFSNVTGSYMSSLGFFKTAETYDGKHGLSLRLDGLEQGINHLARDRAIVIHMADYVSLDFAAQHGRIGRSLGCPALPLVNYAAVIDLIKEGALLYSYGGDEQYVMQSTILNES